MKTFIKSLAILAIVFVLRTLSGCMCRCSDVSDPFDFTTVEIFNLDNTRSYPVRIQNDTIFSRAVAFRVVVRDNQPYFSHNCINHLFSFSNAIACDCSHLLRANDSIVKINIKTLFDINPKILANSDVTDKFVCSKENYFEPENLYKSIHQIYPLINSKTYYDFGVEDFNIYLKDEILKDTAQFIIYVQLKNKVVLTDTTHLLSIKHLQ